VADRLGIRIRPDCSTNQVQLTDLVGMAIRDNPKRAYLLVSTVLGKHLPTDPRVVLGAGRLLGARVADLLSGTDSGMAGHGATLLPAALAGVPGAAAELLARCEQHTSTVQVATVVLGFAETATGLGHTVADALSASYLHSTRRQVAGLEPTATFSEEHSHARHHLLLPEDPSIVQGNQPMVLVDDEMSTGRTVRNTIRALHAIAPGRSRYVVASLVDLRSDIDRAQLLALAAELDVQIDAVALARGQLEMPADMGERSAAILEEHRRSSASSVVQPASGQPWSPLPDLWPDGVREGGRHGFLPAHRAALQRAVGTCVDTLAATITAGHADRPQPTPSGRAAVDVLVVGSEELIYAPLRIAVELADRLEASPGGTSRVRYCTTTRSPVIAIDRADYAIRSRLEYLLPERLADGSRTRYAYNISGVSVRRFTDLVLVIDDEDDFPGLAASLGTLLSPFVERLHWLRIPAYRPWPSRSEPER
jgi:adenine/guanine phosphoribosyltransferase-like PRPP-binding protein